MRPREGSTSCWITKPARRHQRSAQDRLTVEFLGKPPLTLGQQRQQSQPILQMRDGFHVRRFPDCLLAGAQPADVGRVWIDGIDLMQAPESAKRRLSYVPDESPIHPFMTGAELLHFVAAAKRSGIDADVDDLIRAFDVGQHLHTRFDAMSLGTRKKMMLCAAWIGAPRVLLLDEPSNGLDLASRNHLVWRLQQWGRQSAILFTAHDEEFVSGCGAAVVEMLSLFDPEPGVPA